MLWLKEFGEAHRPGLGAALCCLLLIEAAGAAASTTAAAVAAMARGWSLGSRQLTGDAVVAPGHFKVERVHVEQVSHLGVALHGC
jgi:hypothetical protein